MAIVAKGGARLDVAFERAVDDDRAVAAPRCPPVQRAQAGQQFFRLERLGQVIIGPGIQPFGPVHRAAQRRQHQHRRAHPAFAQAAQDGHAINIGEHPVKNDDVEPITPGAQQAGAAAGFPSHPVAGARGQFLHFGGDAGVILDIENLKRHAVPLCSARAAHHPCMQPCAITGFFVQPCLS